MTNEARLVDSGRDQVDSGHDQAERPRSGELLLEVDQLAVEFRTEDGLVRAVNGVSFAVEAGRTLAIVGESGSGKSVTAQAVLGLLQTPPARISGGEIRFRGTDLLTLSRREHRAICGEHIAMVFQDALAALNPVYSVGFQLTEALVARRGMSRRAARKRAIELLDLVQVPNAVQRVREYPHQFSGGMRQRVMIAMALALEPEVLIADADHRLGRDRAGPDHATAGRHPGRTVDGTDLDHS